MPHSFIHSSTVGHHDCFHTVVIMNNTAINMVWKCLYFNLTFTHWGTCLGVVLLDHMAVLLSVFLRSLHSVFHSDCTVTVPSQCMRVAFLPHTHQHLLMFVFLMIIILIGVRRNLNMVLIFISFVVMDVEHFFTWFLIICTSSSQKILFSSFAQLFIDSLGV
jgi:hypothetical protein